MIVLQVWEHPYPYEQIEKSQFISVTQPSKVHKGPFINASAFQELMFERVAVINNETITHIHSTSTINYKTNI